MIGRLPLRHRAATGNGRLAGAFFQPATHKEDAKMGSTTDKMKGMANEAAGKVRQAAGDATNDPEMEARGAAQEGKGKLQQAKGDAKDAVKKVVDGA